MERSNSNVASQYGATNSSLGQQRQVGYQYPPETAPKAPDKRSPGLEEAINAKRLYMNIVPSRELTNVSMSSQVADTRCLELENDGTHHLYKDKVNKIRTTHETLSRTHGTDDRPVPRLPTHSKMRNEFFYSPQTYHHPKRLSKRIRVPLRPERVRGPGSQGNALRKP
jgi:hypothetical protein